MFQVIATYDNAVAVWFRRSRGLRMGAL